MEKEIKIIEEKQYDITFFQKKVSCG